MKRHSRIAAVLAVVLLAVGAVGASRGARKGSSGKAAPAAHTARPPLPAWAPKRPSPEFLRAHALIRPYDMEEFRAPGDSEGAFAARVAGMVRWLVAGYEWFGSLSDAQLQRFQNSRVVKLRVSDLTEAQRGALDRYTAVDDLIINLYEHGARKELANVQVGFTNGNVSNGQPLTGPGPVSVRPNFWVKQRDGRVVEYNSGIIGDLRDSANPKP